MRTKSKILGLALVIVLLATPVGMVAADDGAPPTPSSSFIDGFVLEADNVYGYEILRPASWTSIDLGDRRGYLPPDSADQPNRIMLAVTNLETVSDAFAGKNGLIANYELFRQEPTLSAWMPKTEALWKRNGVDFSIVGQLPSAIIYAVRPAPDQTHLIAYIVSQGQPLGVVLYGFGTFNDLELLKSTGLLADFETMVASASAHQSSSAPTAAVFTAPAITLSPESGPFHSDSGYIADGAFTYRMQTDYYQAPPRVYWLYEYLYYAKYQYQDAWLYITYVTDDPTHSCIYGGGALLQHTIWKMVSRTDGTATDSYTPNQIVDHLNTTTAHMMVYGDGLLNVCKFYYPFTQQ